MTDKPQNAHEMTPEVYASAVRSLAAAEATAYQAGLDERALERLRKTYPDQAAWQAARHAENV